MKQVVVEDVEFVLHGCSCEPEVFKKFLLKTLEWSDLSTITQFGKIGKYPHTVQNFTLLEVISTINTYVELGVYYIRWVTIARCSNFYFHYIKNVGNLDEDAVSFLAFR